MLMTGGSYMDFLSLTSKFQNSLHSGNVEKHGDLRTVIISDSLVFKSPFNDLRDGVQDGLLV